MKTIKLFFAAIMLLFAVPSHAQLTLGGNMAYPNGTPAPNVSITINSGASSITVITDSLGNYYTFFQTNQAPGGVAYLWTDCNGQFQIDSNFYQTTTDTIINNLLYCSTNPTTTCSASFTATVLGNGDVTFTADSVNVTQTYSYSWVLNGSSTYTSASPTISGLAAGTYSMCLTLTNNVTGCVDTFCSSFTIASSGCTATFADSLLQGNTIAFSADYFSWSTAYTWDFGDGTTGTGSSTTHTYSPSGTVGSYVQVCLTVFDSLANCTATHCDSVYIGTTTPTNPYGVQGNVSLGNSSPVSNAVVFLIYIDSAMTGGTLLTAVDTTYALGGSYSFSNVAPGSYLVKAALIPGDPDFFSYLPTYSDSSTIWSSANAVYPSPNGAVTANIYLTPGANNGGPAFIGGLVSQGANKMDGEGDPIEGVQVVVYHTDGTVAAFGFSGVDGTFMIDDLAYGDYEVHAELPGLPTQELQVTLDSDMPSIENIQVEVNSSNVVVSEGGSNSVENLSQRAIQVYPNPASDFLMIDLSNVDGATTVIIRDLAGHTLIEKNLRGATVERISLESLNSGVYILHESASNRASRIVINK